MASRVTNQLEENHRQKRPNSRKPKRLMSPVIPLAPCDKNRHQSILRKRLCSGPAAALRISPSANRTRSRKLSSAGDRRPALVDRMGLGFVVGVFGVLILAHAAYSTIQYRGLLKIMEEEFSGPPMNVVLELLVGLVFCMWAALTVPGKFLSIHPHSDENRIVSLPSNMDFMIFNHRGKVFSLETDMKLKR